MDIFLRISFYSLLFIGLLIILQYFSARYPKINVVFLLFLFIFRLPFVFVYYNFIPGDWEGYYSNSQKLNNIDIGFGTDAVVLLTYPFTRIGLLSIDLFFLYSFLGYIGILLFYLIGHRLTGYTDQVKVWGINIFPWVLLYPSLHLFTVMLGKDPIVLLGLGIVGYSLTFNPIKKFYLLVGLFLIMLVRPHMVFVLMASLVLAILWGKEWPVYKKFVLFSIASVSAIAIIPSAVSFFRINSFTLEAIQLAIQRTEGYANDAGTYIDMSSYPLSLKMFTYLFRPLFIDAPNAILLVYSMENLIFLFLVISVLRVSFFRWIKNQPRITKFCIIFTFLGTLVLSNGLSVFGLFMRQKTMVFLFLLLPIFAFIHDRNQKKIYRIKSANPELPPSHA